MVVRPRVRLLLVAVVAVAAIGLLAASGLDDSLVYYRSPSEVATLSADAGRLRLGGLVQIGSVARRGQDVHFVLTDGVNEVPVVHRGDPPGVFQEGQGALVEGSLDATGVFRSDLLIVKHSNEYRAPDDEGDTTPLDTAGTRR